MNDFFTFIAWSPGIGDPTFIGWFTTFAYLLCAHRSLRVCRAAHTLFEDHVCSQRRLWTGIFIALVFLGLNKQLDIQTLISQSGRFFIDYYSLQAKSKVIKTTFVLVVIFSGACTAGIVYFYFRAVMQQHKYAIIGICSLITYVLLRAATFNQVTLLGSPNFSNQYGWIIELAGITMIWMNARYFLNLYRWRSLQKANDVSSA